MAAVKTGRELLDLLEKSQLLDAEYYATVRPQLARYESGDPGRLARVLVRNLVISEYQVRQLLAGRYKGFYIGKYKIHEVIGAGGMGKVFLAEQITMERLVAIKILASIGKKKGREKEVLARFTREAKAVAALRHPNIIHAYDFDQENGAPYIVMEFVEGIDTAQQVGKFGPLPWKQAADYIRQAASGLQHAHDAGLVHRDVKPGNLLVDTTGQVKLLDLGLCSAFDRKGDDTLTIDQDQLGTVDFIAPEQALDSHSVDARADMYGLGATFYGLLTGRQMFPDKSTAQKLLLHQTTQPRPVSEFVQGVPEELLAILDKMLAKDRDQRVQTMRELELLLKPFAEAMSPPYDKSAIKLRRDDYEPLLSKSPDAADISVATLGKPDSAIENKPDASQVAMPKSMIGAAHSSASAAVDENEFADLSFGGEVTELGLAMAPLPRRGKKKRRSKSRSAINWPVYGGVAGGTVLVVLLSLFLFSRGAESTDRTGDDATAAIGTTDGPSSFQEWRKFSDKLNDDPTLIAHHTFSENWGTERLVENEAKSTRGMALLVENARWGEGRWPQKGALVCNGPGSNHHAGISTEESQKIDFQSTTSVAVWFKVKSFTRTWQTIIGKGDFSWRLQRANTTQSIAVALDFVQTAEDKAKKPPNTRPMLSMAGRTSVVDDEWHLAVIVFEKGPSPNKNILRLYLDGRLEAEREVGTVRITKDPIWVGSNSEPSMRREDRSQDFHGSVDEVAFWSRALSLAEAKQMYRAGRP
ncbi:MAG: protein kinase [Planctomycetaceae bacterium]